MAETGGTGPRVPGRAAAIGTRAGARGSGFISGRLAAAFEAFAALIQAEARAARLAPWLPVTFGIGILLYFAAPAEPSLAAGGTAFVVLAAVTWVSRDRPAAFAVALGCAAVAAGFTAGSLRGAYVAHPVLAPPPARSPLADRPWYGRPLPPDANALARLKRKPPAKPVVEAEGPLATPGDVPVPELPEEPGR